MSAAEATTAAAVVVASAALEKKAKQKKKPNQPKSHPPKNEIAVAAITALHERNGSSLTEPVIRRQTRRGGVNWISSLFNEDTCCVLKVFLWNVIRDAMTYMEDAKRKTVTGMDVVNALKRQRRILYGFGS